MSLLIRMIQKLNSFIIKCKRVLQVTKRPDANEYKTIVKVSGLGMLFIGVIGFIIVVLHLIFFKGG